jgi:hypothetical protein
MLVLAAAVAWYALRINTEFGASLGRTPEASVIFMGLSVAVDLIGLALPSTAMTLWVAGNRLAAVAAWMTWTGTLVMALLRRRRFRRKQHQQYDGCAVHGRRAAHRTDRQYPAA